MVFMQLHHPHWFEAHLRTPPVSLQLERINKIYANAMPTL